MVWCSKDGKVTHEQGVLENIQAKVAKTVQRGHFQSFYNVPFPSKLIILMNLEKYMTFNLQFYLVLYMKIDAFIYIKFGGRL